jgi:hypothetical protein
MILKRDNFKLGIVLGFLAPILGIVCFYLINFRSAKFINFLEVMLTLKSFFSAVITVSLVANGAIFTIYTNNDRDETARGIFVATMVYAIVCLVLKYAF